MTIIPSQLLSKKKKLSRDNSRQSNNVCRKTCGVFGTFLERGLHSGTVLPSDPPTAGLSAGIPSGAKAPGLLQSISYYFCRMLVWFCVSGAVTFSLLALSTLFTFFPQFFKKKKEKDVLNIKKNENFT